MSFLLRLKHWQLFVLTWGPSVLLNLLAFIDWRLLFVTYPLATLLFMIGTFGWVWAIATQLTPLLPPQVSPNLRRFKAAMLVPLVYIVAVLAMVSALFTAQPAGASPAFVSVLPLIILVHLLAIGCIIYGLRLAAKNLKSVELQREAHVAEYLGEFVLIWFSPVGVWLLQPRLNTLIEQAQPR